MTTKSETNKTCPCIEHLGYEKCGNTGCYEAGFEAGAKAVLDRQESEVGEVATQHEKLPESLIVNSCIGVGCHRAGFNACRSKMLEVGKKVIESSNEKDS